MTRTRITWALFAAVPVVLVAALFLAKALSPQAPVQASTGETPLSAVRASTARLASLPDTPALPTPKPKRRTTSSASSGGSVAAGVGSTGGSAASSTGGSGGSTGSTYVPPANNTGGSGSSSGGSRGGSSGGSGSGGGGGCSGEACDFLP